MKTFDVIVVGGGFTGVTAAVELSKTKRVLLLEATSALGGRCRSVRLEGIDCTTDLGGHYFGVAHKKVRALIEELGLDAEVIDYVPGFGKDPVAVCDFESRRVVTRVSDTWFNVQGIDARAPWAEQFRFLVGLLYVSILCDAVDGKSPSRSLFSKQLDSMTYAEFIAKLSLPPWFADLMRSGVEGVWSQSSERMSMLYFLWYLKNNGGFSDIFNDQVGGPQQFGLRCGMQGLIERLHERFGGETHLDAPVAAIRVDETGAEVRMRDGTTYRASDVIVATTPRAAAGIHYEPELPAARRLIHEQRGGYAIKAMVFYDTPWWRECAEMGADMYAWLSRAGHDGIDWILVTTPGGDSHFALTVFVMPELVDRHEGDGEAALHAAIAESMVELVKDPRAREFSKMVVCDWRKQEFVGGGPNTTFGLGVLTSTAEVFNRPDFGRLYFAASEYGTSYTGYIEGAITSGRLVARQLLESLLAEPEGRGIAWGPLAFKLASVPPVALGMQVLRVIDAVRGVVGGIGPTR